MPDPEKPQIVDLGRYRRAAAAAKAAKAAKPKPKSVAPGGGKEPLLGRNPRAGLILALAVFVGLALVFGPTLIALISKS